MTSTPTVAVKVILLLLFIYWINCITCYTCNTWITVDGCNNFETSFWAQTFTDNTPSISVLSSFKEITVEGQYGQVTSIIPHCITSNEGIAINRSLIEAYFTGNYTDIYEYQMGNTIAENQLSTFADIPSSLTFQLPCNVNQNYFTTGVSMNHAIILQYINGGNGRICLDAGDTLSDAGVIGGDIIGSCTTYDYNSNSDMQFTFDTFALLGETYPPTVVTIPTPQPTTIQPSLDALTIYCSGSCSCTGNRDCIINCGEEACSYSTLQCNAGYACTVDCNGEEACERADIEGNGAKSLVVTCSGFDACNSATINCATTVDGCFLDCSDNSGICNDITMTCGTGDCSIDCSGSGSKCSSVNVDASVASSYTCSGTQCSSSITVVTGNPTIKPSPFPTINPTTTLPTNSPTTGYPTVQPTTILPTLPPTHQPTVSTLQPTHQPTFLPSQNTPNPTNEPTIQTSSDPTADLSSSTYVPSNVPSIHPISTTALILTIGPTNDPTKDPTINPTNNPTNDPTNNPTNDPTDYPTIDPTSIPTLDNSSIINSSNSKNVLMWVMVAVCTLICFSFLSTVNYFLRRRRKRLQANDQNAISVWKLNKTPGEISDLQATDVSEGDRDENFIHNVTAGNISVEMMKIQSVSMENEGEDKNVYNDEGR